jgi:hypothetical protein
VQPVPNSSHRTEAGSVKPIEVTPPVKLVDGKLKFPPVEVGAIHRNRKEHQCGKCKRQFRDCKCAKATIQD